ncbi:gp165 [Sphingomonas phage PAU]|uniref:gp165 n=1 Tax=Sphingomonas phage PAU TaxID=1150991 RepID=UPI00025732F1|nr:gp165 [Sphingomonas phage PAU]AFF28163.1 gp165 [Sphingomonas phage PAU]
MPVWLKEQPNNLQILHSELLDNYVQSWIERSFQIIPPHSMDTNYITWKCFGCSKPLSVKFDSVNHKDFCCKNCKHFAVGKPNAIMLRFMWSFNMHIQSRIINNSANLSELLEQ